jgi:hypothetical protein
VTLQRLLQEPQSRTFVPFLGDIAFKNLTFMIHRAPQIAPLAVDLYEDLVEVPAPVAIARKVSNPTSSNLACEHRAKTVPPKPHRLVADVDPALEQQVLDVSQAQWETGIHHYHEADHLRR